MNDEQNGKIEELSYEEGLEELTRLVDEIGRDDCPVDQLEVRVRKAADLLKELRKRLASTEVTIREVLEDLEVDRNSG